MNGNFLRECGALMKVMEFLRRNAKLEEGR